MNRTSLYSVLYWCLCVLALATYAHAVELELVPQLGHAGKFTVLAVNADETLIATGGDDKRVILYDAQSGLQLRAFDGHGNQITKISFPDQQPLLFVQDYSGVSYLWNYETGKLLRKYTGRKSEQSLPIIASPSGRTILQMSEDLREIDVQDTLTGKSHVIPSANAEKILAISSDQELIIQTKQGSIELRSLVNGQIIRSLLRIPSDNPVQIRLSDDQRFALLFSEVAFAEAPAQGNVTPLPPKKFAAWARFIELATGKVMQSFPEIQGERYLTEALIHHDNNLILGIEDQYGDEPKYRVWNLARNRQTTAVVPRVAGSRMAVWKQFLPEQGKLQLIFREYEAGQSREYLLDFETGRAQERIYHESSANLTNHNFNTNAHSVWENGQFKVRDRAGKKFLTTLRPRSAPVEQVGYVEEGKLLQVSSHPRQRQFWNLTAGKPGSLEEYLAANKSLSDLPAQWWYFATRGLMTPRGLIAYPIPGFEYDPKVPSNTRVGAAVSISPGMPFAAGSDGSAVEENNGDVQLLAISPDHSRVLCQYFADIKPGQTLGEDSGLRIYELVLDQQKLTAQGKRVMVSDNQLFYRENKLYALSVQHDTQRKSATIRIKEAFFPQHVQTYNIFGLGYHTVSRDGKFLIDENSTAVGAGGMVRVFDVMTGKLQFELSATKYVLNNLDNSLHGQRYLFAQLAGEFHPELASVEFAPCQAISLNNGAALGAFGGLTNWYCYHERSCSIKTIYPVVDERDRVLSFKNPQTAVVSTIRGENAIEIPVNTDGITDIALYQDQFAISKADGTIDVYDIKAKKLLCTLIIARSGGDWLVFTPEGLFDSSPNGTDLLAYRIAGTIETVPLDRFQQKYWTPGLLEKISRGERPLPALNITKSLPPKLRFAAGLKSGMNLSSNKLTVEVNGQTRNGYPIKSFQILVDERPYRGQLGTHKVASPDLNEQNVKFEVEFENPGEHTIKVLAETEYVQGSTDELRVVYLGGGVADRSLPSLYILAIGVAKYQVPSRSLDFAHLDAQALPQAFEKNSTKLFEKIDSKVLCNEQATRRNVFSGLQWLREKMTGNPKAIGIVFFAGHGEIDPRDGTLYFLPYDTEDRDFAGTAIEADTLKKQLASIPGRLMLILDSCHAGEIGAAKTRGSGDVSDQLLRDLSSEQNGLMVICSALGNQKAQESRKYEHGVFTQALLEGISGQGNGETGDKELKPRLVDGGVYLSELNAYLGLRVRQLTKGEQSPIHGSPAMLKDIPISKP